MILPKYLIMKKLLFIIFTILAFSLSLSAQADQDQLLQELEKMQEELMKQFGGFNFQFDDPQIEIDTFFFNGFGEGDDWTPLGGGSFDLTEMMDLLQQQMQQMDAQDWEELEELFQGFGSFGPMIPAPDSLDNYHHSLPENSNPADKPKKKRKVYTL